MLSVSLNDSIFLTTLSMIINSIGLESTVCSSTVLHAVEVEYIFRYDVQLIEHSLYSAKYKPKDTIYLSIERFIKHSNIVS